MARNGEDVIGNMAGLRLQELQAANAGQVAEGLPIHRAETAATQQAPGYVEMLDQQAAASESRAEAAKQDERWRKRSRRRPYWAG